LDGEAEYNAEAARLTAEMEQAIADAIASFNNTLAEAKA
jgi:cytochrome c peroxidase